MYIEVEHRKDSKWKINTILCVYLSFLPFRFLRINLNSRIHRPVRQLSPMRFRVEINLSYRLFRLSFTWKFTLMFVTRRVASFDALKFSWLRIRGRKRVSDLHSVFRRSRQLLILGRPRRKVNPDRPSGHPPACWFYWPPTRWADCSPAAIECCQDRRTRSSCQSAKVTLGDRKWGFRRLVVGPRSRDTAEEMRALPLPDGSGSPLISPGIAEERGNY